MPLRGREEDESIFFVHYHSFRATFEGSSQHTSGTFPGRLYGIIGKRTTKNLMLFVYLSHRWQLQWERTFETTSFSSTLWRGHCRNTTEQEWSALAGKLACNRTSGVDCSCAAAACQFHREHSSHLWPTTYHLYQLD